MTPASLPNPVATDSAPAARIRALLQQAAALLRAQDEVRARVVLEAVLLIDGNNLIAIKQLAALSLKAERYNDAFRYAARGFQLAGDDAETLTIVGGVLYELGQLEIAGAALREALRQHPGSELALENYALVLQGMNRAEEAAEILAALIRKTPKASRLWRRLSQVRHFPKGAAETRQIRKLLHASGLSPRDRAQLHFALAKMHQDGGDIDAAFKAYRAANRLMADSAAPGVERVRRGSLRKALADLTAVFSPDFVSAWYPTQPSQRPLTLVLGPSRSGKTLVESTLSAHPAIKAYGELDVLREVLKAGGGRFLQTYPHSVKGISEIGARRAAERLDAAWGDPLDPTIATHLVTMPNNIMHAGLVMLLNPATRLLVCERDAADTAMAIFMKYFEKDQHYAWEIDTIAEYICVYRRLARHWSRVFPGRVSWVRYEDLLMAPDAEVDRILKGYGLSWHEACANSAGLEVRPEVVGYAGSAERRTGFNSAFAALSERFASYRGLFTDALERAERRIDQASGREAAALGPTQASRSGDCVTPREPLNAYS